MILISYALRNRNVKRPAICVVACSSKAMCHYFTFLFYSTRSFLLSVLFFQVLHVCIALFFTQEQLFYLFSCQKGFFDDINKNVNQSILRVSCRHSALPDSILLPDRLNENRPEGAFRNML